MQINGDKVKERLIISALISVFNIAIYVLVLEEGLQSVALIAANGLAIIVIAFILGYAIGKYGTLHIAVIEVIVITIMSAFWGLKTGSWNFIREFVIAIVLAYGVGIAVGSSIFRGIEFFRPELPLRISKESLVALSGI